MKMLLFPRRESFVSPLLVAVLGVLIVQTLALAQSDGEHPPGCGSGSWQFGTPMPLARNNTGGAKDNQGRIYIPGGNALIGGSNIRQSTVMRFDEDADQWEVLAAELNIARMPAVASDELGRIYAIGGFTNNGIEASVERYDPTDPGTGWVFAPPLPSPRADAQAVRDSHGRIYVAGGYDSLNNRSNSVFVFDPGCPELGWSLHSNMLMPRTSFGLALDSKDRMYAAGGGSTGGQTDTAERYDPVLGFWQFIDNLNSTRDVGVAVADCNDFIYAIGGWEPGYTCKVERFNAVTEVWEDFDPINQCRNNMAGILGDSGRLYTFGGDAGFTPLTTVEFFQTCVCGPSEDADGDGVPDAGDECPDSDLGPTIVIDECDTGVESQLLEAGCTMADLIGQCAGAAVNNAVFVCCVAHLTNGWKQDGVISGAAKGPIQSCAAQANIP